MSKMGIAFAMPEVTPPEENHVDNLTRPIMGIENRTPLEVFDIMCDRIKQQPPDLQAIWGQYPDSESVLATGNPWTIAAWFRVEASRLARALQLKSEQGTEWRCFHCGDVFTDEDEAREHFGPTMDSEPICQVTAERYREVEGQLAQYQNESDATSRTFYDIGHRAAVAECDAEQKGYDRGIADAKAHPHELGLVKAENRNQTPERVQELLEANNRLLERARAAGVKIGGARAALDAFDAELAARKHGDLAAHHCVDALRKVLETP